MNVITDVALPILLGGVMLSMGLTLTMADFARVFTAPRPIVVGLTSLLVVVPLIGFAVASLAPVAAGLALGIFMIATCPGGTFSNLLTSYGRGDVALSISMTAVGCVVYVAIGPLWLEFGLQHLFGSGAAVDLPRAQIFVELFLILVLPTGIGMLGRAFLRERVRVRLESAVKNVSAPGVVAVFVYIFVVNYRTLDWNVLPAVAILNLLTVGTGWIAAHAARSRPDQALAVVCEHAVRQEGTAIYIATSSLLIPQAALPLMLNSFVGAGVGLLFIWGRQMVGASRHRAAAANADRTG